MGNANRSENSPTASALACDACAGAREDERPLGFRQNIRCARDGVRCRARHGSPGAARRGRETEFRDRRAQHLARQRQIDRPARLGGRDLKRAVDHVLELIGIAQLIVPFAGLAHHRGLVEHFLAPMDAGVARAALAIFRQRRAPGGEQHRHLVARGIEQRVDAVRGADADVEHHRRRLAGHEVIAVRHRGGDVLVRHRHDLQPRRAPLGADRGQRLDHRREVRAAVGEQVFNAALGQKRQIGLRHGVDGNRLLLRAHVFLHARRDVTSSHFAAILVPL